MAAGCADVPPGLVADLVAAATLAPSMHNAQPWRFRYEPASQTIELHADPDRMLCTPSSSRPDWLRAGYGLPVPHTPRRPVSELLDNGPDQGND
jgi:hypothetical protein